MKHTLNVRSHSYLSLPKPEQHSNERVVQLWTLEQLFIKRGSTILRCFIIHHSNFSLVGVDHTMVRKIPCAVTGGGSFFFRQLDSIPFDNIVIHHCSVLLTKLWISIKPQRPQRPTSYLPFFSLVVPSNISSTLLSSTLLALSHSKSVQLRSPKLLYLLVELHG